MLDRDALLRVVTKILLEHCYISIPSNRPLAFFPNNPRPEPFDSIGIQPPFVAIREENPTLVIHASNNQRTVTSIQLRLSALFEMLLNDLDASTAVFADKIASLCNVDAFQDLLAASLADERIEHCPRQRLSLV